MDNINLIESFTELKDVKNIDKEKMIKVMQEVFGTIITKKYGSSENFDIIVNPNKGDLEIWRNRTVVEDNYTEYNENLHIKLTDVNKIESDFEVGEDFADEIKIIDFGRRSISSIRQVLKSKILDIGKEDLHGRYIERIGEIITGEVYQILRKEVIILDEDGTELVLPKTEQLHSDFFRKGESVRAIISGVEMRNNNISITLSRTSNLFLEKLFEIEIPEVLDGLITVKGVVREPGVKAKVAVESYDDRIDPVGTCVGVRGSRINGVLRELKNENIDVINYTTNKALYIQRALNQSKVSNIEVNEERKVANVYINSDQIALAIGKGGMNIRLASKLTGFKINVYADNHDVEDVSIDEFSDEIDGWIIDILKGIGLDTAQSILKSDFNYLLKQTDLEEETVRELIKVLETEFN